MAYHVAYFFGAKAMETATLSSKGQLVIPRKIRESANVSAGDAFRVHFAEGEIRLRPVAKTGTASIDEVAGCLGGAGRKLTPESQAHKTILARLKAQDDATLSPAKKSKRKTP